MFAVGTGTSTQYFSQLYRIDVDGSNFINIIIDTYYDIEPDWWGIVPVSAANSSITVAPDRAAADGQAAITLNVTVRDNSNLLIPNATISLSSGNPNLVFDRASGTTDANGTFTAHVTSAVITNGIVQVQANGVVIGNPIVRFIGGDPAVTIFGPPTILAGQNLVYAVRASNDGFLPLHNITVRAGLSLGSVAFESEQHPGDVQLVSQFSNQVTWLVPDLAPGEAQWLYVVGRSAANLTLGTTLAFGAQVAATPDVNLSNDEAVFTTRIVTSQIPGSVSQPAKLKVDFTSAPDVSAAAPGNTVHFTITVSNPAQRNDSVDNLVVSDGLTSQTHYLTPSGPLAPGQSATTGFDYTLQDSDAPQLTAWVTVSGQGVSYPAVQLTASRRAQVAVNTNPTPGAINLALDRSSIPPVLLPGIPIHLPLLVVRSGSAPAANVTLRLSLPPDVSLVEIGPGGDSSHYDPPTRRVTWTWNSLTAGANVSPVVYTSAPLGSVLDFDLAVSTSTGETTLDDNTLTLSLPVVAPAPSDVTLEAPERSFVVADGQDSLTLRLTVRDQLGNPLPGVQAVLLADQGDVTFEPQTVTTDELGVATLTLTATQVGPALLTANVEGGPAATLSIQRRPSPVYLANPQLTVGVGGTDALDIAVLNTHAGDKFDLSVTGLSALNPAWVHFEPATLALSPGQYKASRLVIAIPAGQCGVVATTRSPSALPARRLACWAAPRRRWTYRPIRRHCVTCCPSMAPAWAARKCSSVGARTRLEPAPCTCGLRAVRLIPATR